MSAPHEPSLRRIAIGSVVAVVVGFGGLGAWAASSRIDAAVPASGVFVAAGKRKTVTLLDPGILTTLLVRDGDRVAKGQVLLTLDDVQARTTLAEVEAQYWGARARAARLLAERDDKRSLTMPDDVLEAARAAAIAPLVEAEQRLFAARWANYDEALRVQQRKIAQQQAEIDSAAAALASVATRLDLAQREGRTVDYMFARGYDTEAHMLDQHGTLADLAGQRGQLLAHLDEARHAAAQAQGELAALVTARHEDIAKDLADATATGADARQRMDASTDLLSRRVVRAPEDGVVTDIKAFTPGSSIGAGQPVMDLVPADDHLLVEAEVSPLDIEHVHVGQAVNLRLTSYKAHRVPVLTGHLVYVGADRQANAQGEPVFLARAELDPKALAGLDHVSLYPGMPADVLIIGGERSALDYLIGPIRDGMRHAMIEE